MPEVYKTTKTIFAIIAAIAALRFISLGMYPLFDPTEGRYAEIGRKMLELNNWVTPFIEYNVPFWAKPPLSFWLTAISYKIFGVNDFAARLPSFLVMAGIVWLVRWTQESRKLELKKGNAPQAHDSSIPGSYLTTLILISMGLFFYLAGGVMTDPTLAFSITLSMIAFWRAVVIREKLWGYIFFAGIAMAMLAKGPIGVVLMGIPIFIWVMWQNKWKDLWHNLPWVYGTLLMLVAVLPWYIMAEIRTPGFLRYFIIGEHFERFLVKGWKGDLYGSGRAHPIGTIWLFGLAALAPWSLLLLAAPFIKSFRIKLSITSALDKSWQIYLWLWALTPLVFFTISRNVLVTYVISALPAFAILFTPVVAELIKNTKGKVLVLGLASFVPLVFIGLIIAVNIHPYSKYIPSQQQIINDYTNISQGADIPIIYLMRHPYSGNFYSGGKATEVLDIEELRPYLDKEVFIVVPKAYYPRILGDVQEKLEIIADKNNSILLHNNP